MKFWNGWNWIMGLIICKHKTFQASAASSMSQSGSSRSNMSSASSNPQSVSGRPVRQIANEHLNLTSNFYNNREQRPSSGPIPDGMEACRVCGRHFNKDRIEKHQSICKKTSTKKRRIFDATKHRVQVTSYNILEFRQKHVNELNEIDCIRTVVQKHE